MGIVLLTVMLLYLLGVICFCYFIWKFRVIVAADLFPVSAKTALGPLPYEYACDIVL